MGRWFRYGLLALFFYAFPAFSQVEVKEDLVPETAFKTYRQHSFFGQIHGNGWGGGYRFGKIRSIYKYTFQEFEFLKDKHPRVQKRQGVSTGFARRYAYGALNQLYVLRYGLGVQRTLNEKPYWGGIQVDYSFSGGAALGLAIPQYLRILYLDNTTEEGYYTKVEKYDPDNIYHNDLQNIFSAGPYFKGLLNLRPYPGFYGKFAFHFDFGKYHDRVNAIEAGMMVDVFPIPVPMMAFSKKNFFFANFFIAYHFGRRK